MTRVEERRAPFGFEIEWILREIVLTGEGLGGRAREVHRREVVHRLRHPVGHVETDDVAETTRDAELSGVITRSRYGLEHGDRREVAWADAICRAVAVDAA